MEGLQMTYHKYRTNYTIQSPESTEQLFWMDVTQEPQNLPGKTLAEAM